MRIRTHCLAVIAVLVISGASAAWADESAAWAPSTRDAIASAFAQQQAQPAAQQQQPATAESDPQPSDAPVTAQGPEPHPQPTHTGFAALARNTVGDFVAFPKRKSTWVILGIGAGLALIAHPADDNLNSHLAGSDTAKALFAPGKVLGAAYTQVGVALGLYAIGRWVVPPAEGVDQTNKWSHLGFDLLRAQIVSQTVVQGMKYAIRRDRPTGECCSFPSGHAATVFAVASVLERHLGYRFAWPTVVAATYVGASRLHDNRHFLSDVLFGAAVGTATGWTVVGRHGRESYAFVPTPVHGGVALMLTRVVDEHHGR